MNSAQKKIHRLIQDCYLQLQAKYPGYSLRRYARKLDIQPPILSDVLRGKRKITKKLASRLLNNLELNSATKITLIEEIEVSRKASREEDESYYQLNHTEVNFISNWWYSAILRLIEVKSIQENSLKKVAEELDLSLPLVKEAVSELAQHEFIFTQNGILKSTNKIFTTTTDIPSSAIMKNHKQGLELGQKFLNTVPVELRDYSAITVTLSPEDLPKFKKKIEKFRRNLMKEMLATKKKEVYRLQIQLFPLTHKKNPKKDI